ncbi:hypothetical protein N7468_003568 [Penicillium chermesinum]|uniref:Rieske domain-containing protein n=1 Tax=Penicillium chermesinum TaxID=63820 RepID=A0A9W9P6Y5_9EURO|nr:uncharacterized protein N7468_003568 [Penicillium chermesinum]KAJ5238949.1 hypothetical protein N7468_003568 [Penicillium chermesinum]
MDIQKEQESKEGAWHKVGMLSEFPDISHESIGCKILPGCKTKSIPKPQDPKKSKANRGSGLEDQVRVFKHKGFMHAIDNQCPHSSFPLKQGSVFDIEDGAGIRCFRHGWQFDLFTGTGDRGSHTLNLWDIELRNAPASGSMEASETGDKEVWVRRPPSLWAF